MDTSFRQRAIRKLADELCRAGINPHDETHCYEYLHDERGMRAEILIACLDDARMMAAMRNENERRKRHER